MKLEPFKEKKSRISRLSCGVLVSVGPQIMFEARCISELEWDESQSSKSIRGHWLLVPPAFIG